MKSSANFCNNSSQDTYSNDVIRKMIWNEGGHEYTGEYEGGWLVNYLDMEDYILVGNKEDFENAQSASQAALLWGISYERALNNPIKIDGHDVYKTLQHKEERVQKAEELYAIFAGKEF